jgi:hypothetical protein
MLGEVIRKTFAICLIACVCISTAYGADEYDRIREKAAELMVAINKAQIDPTSEGKDSKLEKTYSDYAYLFTDNKLEKLEELIEEGDGTDAQAMRQSTSDLIRYHAIQYRVSSVMDNLVNAFRDNIGNVDGNSITLRDAEFKIGLSENRDTRRKMFLAVSKLYSSYNVFKRSLTSDLDIHAKKMGYNDYNSFLIEMQGWNLTLLNSTADALLTETNATYEASMDKWADKELGMKVRKIRSYDAYRMFFFPSVSAQVDQINLEDVAKNTLAEFGIKLKNQRTIKIDIREKKNRAPYAIAHKIEPGKGELTMVPTGMITDLVDFMGALGQIQFYGLMSGDLPFEKVYDGTNIFRCTYGALFEMICEEPAWIGEHLKLKDTSAEEVAEALQFRRMFKIRNAISNYKFQQALLNAPRTDGSLYGDLRHDILLWKHTKNDYEAYQMANDDYHSSGVFMGYALAAQIKAHLSETLGAEWYKKAEFGEMLEKGTSKGEKLTIEEFLALWGIDSFEPTALAVR